MAIRWVYCPDPQPEDDVLSVAGEEHRHLRVSRARPGERVEVFDGNGRVWTGEVMGADRRSTRIRLAAVRDEPSPAGELVLAQALIPHPPFAWILEKSVEIGVARVVPFRSARSNVAGSPPETRWRRIIVEAAKQSKRPHLPRLDPVRQFDDLIGDPASSKVLFAERGGGTLKAALCGFPVLYFVGPEGGWTPEELKAAEDAGVRPVHLGSGILRSETAAIVGAALIGYELGVFQA